ncbi:hypothetical protein [Pseudomonas edaphica]|uniref:hypothetical protein n=1 Tax=Pseudomonas edaphica TaxID=2006980 RepID=UPI003D1139CF
MIAHSGGSVYYASVGADSNGYWEATPTTDLVVDANNWVDLALIAKDAEGKALSSWVGVQLTVLLTSTGGGAMADGTPPVINSPANNSSVQALRPTFTGKAAPNARIGVHNDAVNVYYGDCYADANGNWTYPFPQDLAPGQVTLKFGQFSQSARLSADTAHTLNIALSGSGNALPPGSAPQLTSPTTVNSLRPLLTGKAAPNAIVYVYLEGGSVLFGKPQADSNGDWQLQLSQDIYSSSTPLSLAEFNANGALMSGWTAVTLTMSTAPTSNALPSGSPPQLTSPTTVNSLRPLLTGKAAPNAIVYVYLEGGSVLFGKPQADSNGDWQLQLSQDIYSSSTPLSLAEFNANGALMSGWTAVTLTMSTGGGAMADGTPPVINSPANNSSVQTVRPTFTGKAAPNARIGVHNDAVNVYYGDCYADANGNWTYPFPQDLAPGQVTLKFGQFSQSARLSADTAHTLNIALSGSGNALPPGSAPQLTSPTTVNSLRPLLTGKAAPNAIVYVYLEGGSVLFGKPQADSNGDWQLQLSQDIYSSSTPLSLAEFNANGALMSGWTAVTLTMSTGGGAMADGTPPVINSPANNSSVQTVRPTFTGKAAPNARIGVHNDAVNVYYGDCYADANGNWTYPFPQDLAPGQVTLKFGQFSQSARLSADTAHTLNIALSGSGNALPPGSAPQLTSPTTVNSLRPLLTGKAAPNAIVYVYLEGGSVLFGKPQADSNGDWQLQLSQDIYSSSTPLSLAEFNANGALMSGWTAVTLTMSTGGGAMADGTPPVINSPANNSSVQTVRPTFTGKAAPNARIGVHNDAVNVYYGDCYADANGNWTYPFPQDLAPGQVTLKFGQFSQSARLSADTAHTLNIALSGSGNALPPGSAPQLTSPTTVNSLRPLLTGKAAPNAIVYVYLEGGSVLFGKPQADSNGDWQLQLSQDIYSSSTPLALAEFNANGALMSGWTAVTLTMSAAPTSNALPSGSAPQLTSPTTVNSLRPLLTGKAAPNAIVYVYLEGGSVLFGKPQADSNGDWQLQLSQDIYSSSTPLSLAEFNANGALMSGWTAVTLTMSTGGGAMADGTPPVINSPANNSSVQTVRPTFTGKAAPNARIGVHNDAVNVYYGDCYADANGNWTYPFPQDLAPGQVTLKFGQFSQSARLSADTAHTLNIALSGSGNALPPGSAPQLTSPTTVNSLRPLLTGKAAPNAIVYVYLEGGSVLFGKPQADSNGDWQLQLSQDIYSSSTPLALAEFNANGALMSGWTAVTLTMSAAPTSNALPSGSAPQLTSPTTVNSLRPLLTGKAAPNAIVYVYLEGGSVLFGKPQADSNGDWQLQLSQDIYSSSTPLSLAEFNANGALMSGWTAVTLTMSTGGGAMADGTPPVINSPANNSSVQTVRPTFTGKAAPNARIGVHNDAVNVYYGDCYADANGNWTYPFPQDLAPGQVTLKFGQFSQSARLSADTAHTLNIALSGSGNALPPGSAPQLTSPTTVNSLRPLLTGKAAPNAIVYVYLEGGSVLFGKPQADSNGDWQLQLSQDIYSSSTPLSLAEFNANGALMSGWTAVTLTMSKT